MSVIIRVIYEGTTYDLDIESQSPIRLDVSAIENTEIGEFFGVGSQNFTLPGTKTNNSFFKHAYNVGSTAIPAFSNTIDGRIISNSQTILKGQFQLIEVIKDEKGYVNYNCTMTDEVVQFKDAIQNKLIKDGDWSAYTHTLDTGSILDSWSNNLLNGDVYYPLADYGIDDPENQGNFPLYGFSNGGVGNYFDNPLTPIKPQQFLPAVRAKAVLKVIAAQVGFEVTGSFITSGDFSNLMILPKGQEEMGIVVSGSENPIGYAINNYTQVLPAQSGPAIGEKLAANTIVLDPVNKFNVSGSDGIIYYEADGVGNYEAAAQIGFFNPMSFSQGEVQVDLKLVRGSFPFSSTVIAQQTNSFKSTDGFQTFTMNVGGSWNSSTAEQVWVYVDYYQLSGTPSIFNNLNLIGNNTKLEVTVAPANYVGASVNMGLQFPSDLKSIDIVTGLIKQFNLIVYPDYNRDKTIVFEQFDDWIRKGEKKDWTDKWDTAERVAINHTVDEEPAELLFSNADDNDRFSVEAKESEPYYQYGTIRVLADNNVSQGKKEIKNSFGPVVLGGPFIYDSEKADGTPTYNIDLGSSVGFPHLYKFDNNGLKSYKFKPRLGYKVNNTIPSGSQMVIGNSASDKTIFSGSYGTISNVNGIPARDGDANLLFNNTYFKFVGPGLNLQATRNNFDTYWKTYIDSLYWDGNRKIILDILFSADEYKDIKLNDIIFLKDQQYRINKITGLNVVNDDVVTVELIRLFPAYYDNNPDCDFTYAIDAMECDFTFEAENIGGVTPTPTPSPTPAVCLKFSITCNSSNGCTGLNYIDCSGNGQSTGFQPFNTTIFECGFSTSNVPGDGYTVSQATDPGCQSPTPTPTPTPTLPPGPTPTPTPGGPTPTPSPTPLPIFSYTGLADYSSYNQACSGSTEVTIYTRGEIGTGSVVYDDSNATNVFDFYRFFIDEATGIGYEFVDPNTTGVIVDTLDDACNVEIFNLYINFNEYDACAESVSNIVYAAPGSTLANGTILYEDINLQYSWWGQTNYEIKFIESGSSPRQIYYNTATGVSASGTDECYTVYEFDGWDSTATTPPAAVCGDTDETFYAEGVPSIGDNLFTDADLTDYIFTGEKFVYNDDANVLYVMSGSTGGNGSGWVIGSVTSSYCSPATPTPSPTPAPIVTQMSVSASWDSYYDACNNAGFTGTLYHAQIWDGVAPAGYEEYFYEDSSLTNIFDFYQYVVDTSTGIGYQLPDPNTTGRVISTGSNVCNPSIFDLFISFNEYDACTEAVSETVYAEPDSTLSNGTILYEDIELTRSWFGQTGYDIKFIESGSSPKQIYYNTSTGVSQSGTDTCYEVVTFDGWDSTAGSPPTAYCGSTDETFYLAGTASVGDNIFTDANLTDPIFTGENFVYNDDDNELYTMSGSTGGTGTDWVIGTITSNYCTPPTPTPSPTPAPIVTALGGSTGSTDDNDGFAPICENDPTATLVTSSAWLKATWNPAGTGSYDYNIYKDASTTQLWTQVSWIIDGNNDGYYMGRENLGGAVQQFYDGPICQSGSAIDVLVQFQSTFDDFCSGSGYYNKEVFISESRSTINDYDYIFENESCTEGYDDQYRTIRETSNGNVWVVADQYNQPATGSRETGQVFPHDPQCNVPIQPEPTITPPPTATPTPTPNIRWMILEGELCTQTSSTQRYNWYGDANNFPAALAYDSNTGWCMDMYYIQDGYNSNYPEMNCSTRYEYYNTCSDCQSQTNAQPCTGPTPPTATPVPTPSPTPTPTVTPAPTPTPSPTPAPQWRSFAVYECGTTDTYYFAYYSSSTITDLYNKVFKYGSTCYKIYGEVEYWSSDPIIASGSFFFDSCTDCQLTL